MQITLFTRRPAFRLATYLIRTTNTHPDTIPSSKLSPREEETPGQTADACSVSRRLLTFLVAMLLKLQNSTPLHDPRFRRADLTYAALILPWTMVC